MLFYVPSIERVDVLFYDVVESMSFLMCIQLPIFYDISKVDGDVDVVHILVLSNPYTQGLQMRCQTRLTFLRCRCMPFKH